MLAFIATVGSFVPGLFGKKLSFKAAKIVGGVILVALLVGLLLIGKWAYDASVIADHEAHQRAENAEKITKADRAADNATEPDVQAFQNQQIEIEEAMTEARRADPKGAASTVGPVTRSYYDSLPEPKEKRR